MTVCRISRNNAENRVKAMISGKPISKKRTVELEEEVADIEEVTRDLIFKRLAQKFRGHELARLIEAVIKAQGYVTSRSEPGPDGGVDILAGSGPLRI
jgi:restriction system protein